MNDTVQYSEADVAVTMEMCDAFDEEVLRKPTAARWRCYSCSKVRRSRSCPVCDAPRPLNRHKLTGQDLKLPKYQYIGRGTPFGNPYKVGMPLGRDVNVRVRSREHAVDLFRGLLHDPIHGALLRATALKHLPGKTLVCSCAPAACHGDVLLDFLREKGKL